jgi:hypothetical protein
MAHNLNQCLWLKIFITNNISLIPFLAKTHAKTAEIHHKDKPE